MSRTDKDAPWWVRVNRREITIAPVHNHYWRTSPVAFSITEPALDEDFNEIWEAWEREERIHLGIFSSDVKYSDEDSISISTAVDGTVHVWRELIRSGETLQTKQAVVGEYPSSCTIHWPLMKTEDYIIAGTVPRCYYVPTRIVDKDATQEVKRNNKQDRRIAKQKFKEVYRGVTSENAEELNSEINYSYGESMKTKDRHRRISRWNYNPANSLGDLNWNRRERNIKERRRSLVN